jgi:hypothetical protein
MATTGTRLVRPILTLLILCFLTSSQAAVRPMLSIRAASATDTRIGFDSMNVLHFGAAAFLGCLSADNRRLPRSLVQLERLFNRMGLLETLVGTACVQGVNQVGVGYTSVARRRRGACGNAAEADSVGEDTLHSFPG